MEENPLRRVIANLRCTNQNWNKILGRSKQIAGEIDKTNLKWKKRWRIRVENAKLRTESIWVEAASGLEGK